LRKIITSVVAAALLLAALTVFVCTEPKYNNPIDKDGDKESYLGGRADDPDYPEDCKALTLGSDGIPIFFTDQKCKPCDATMPKLTLVGPKSVTIDEKDDASFRKWMNKGGGIWDSLITWDASYEVNVKVRLTKGGVTDIDDKQIPPVGDYMIIYRIEKDNCDPSKPPYGREESRGLTVIPWVAEDNDTARIILTGDKTIDVKQGSTYVDDGVTVTVGGRDSTAKMLDSVTVKFGSKVEQTLKDKPIVFSKISINTNVAVESRYTITYYASRPGKNSVKAERTLNIVEASPTGWPEAVIVLDTYRYSVGGKTLDSPDTVMTIGSKDSDYKEKGVKEAYYTDKEGKKSIPPGSVSIVPPTGSSTIGSTRAPAERKYRYELGDGSGYKGVSVSRTVFMVDNTCEGPAKPLVELSPTGDLEITAGVTWDYAKSWKVTNKDIVEQENPNAFGSNGFQFIVDFDGGKLDPKSPKAGTYTVTYVGLSKCGVMSDPITRKVTVK